MHLSGTDTLRVRSREKGSDLRTSFTFRTVAFSFGIELPYAALVPFAYLRFVGAVPGERGRIVAAAAILYVIKTVLCMLLLVRKLRPIEEWRQLGDKPRGASPLVDALILRAGISAYKTPLSFATVWALAWALMYVVLTALLPVLRTQPFDYSRYLGASALFALACFAAALALGYSIFGRLLSPIAGLISLAARERDLTIPGRMFSLGGRLAVVSVSMAVAPTSWMAAMVIAQATGPMSHDAWLTLVLFATVAVGWTPVCAGFVANAIASPFRDVGGVIEQIIHRGDVERLERVPVYFKDEIGALASGVNAMVDRLQETSARMRAYLAERERLLEDAARRAAQLQAVLDNIVEGVFVCDAEGRITMINASGLRLLGLDRERDPDAAARAPTTFAELMRLHHIRHADGKPFTRDELPLARALAGETIVQEEEILSEEEAGRDVFLRTSAAPMRADSGAILGAVAVARDVSEVMQLDLVKDQFIRVAAHELKTPVTIMKGYALTLLRHQSDVPESYRKMLDALNRGADRINHVVDDLLAISQASLDLPKVAADRVDLRAVVQEAVATAQKHTTKHTLHLGAEPRPLWVRGDAARLRQVMAILLDNAAKYSPEGGDVDISVAVGPPPEGGRPEAVVSVRDRGVGIPVEKQGRIFQLFYRAHTDTPHDYGGLGVGLYLARDLITRQRGHMWFESEEGRGSTFHFRVPLA